MDEFRHKHEDELENVRSKLTSVQSEKKTLALKIADMQAEKSQMEGEIKALNKAQKWVYIPKVILQGHHGAVVLLNLASMGLVNPIAHN